MKKEDMKHYSCNSAFKIEVSLEIAVFTRFISNCAEVLNQKFFAIIFALRK